MSRLTREEVLHIVGRMDDFRVAEIIASGATKDELLEARQWVSSDDSIQRALHRQPHGRVARLCEILSADEPDLEEGY
jgi:hypothetical protein